MKMLTLVKPSLDYLEEIHSYRNEMMNNNSQFHGDSGLGDVEDISAWIKQCKLMENKKTLSNPAWVEAEQFMLVFDHEKYILGMINFRHDLNDYLAECAGHIGYGIRPLERRKGYATYMLKLCLEECRKRKLDKVLLTCNIENEASRKTIIACGGIFERNANDHGEILERYFIYL